MSALTKVFIVLQLVCSLALSVLIVLMVSRQENYRASVNNANVTAMGSQAEVARLQQLLADNEAKYSSAMTDVKNQLDSLTKANVDKDAALARAEQSRVAAEARNAQLTNTAASAQNLAAGQQALLNAQAKELADLRPQVAKLLTDNAQLSRTASDQKTALDAAEMAIRKLQEQLVSLEQTAPKTSTGGGGGTTAEVAQPNVPINGRVSKIGEAAGRSMIELPLGTRDGVQVGTRFYVTRGGPSGGYVGDAVVQNVSTQQSVAVVTITKPGESVQVGDLVTTSR